jgi:choloylglycine hydrolase
MKTKLILFLTVVQFVFFLQVTACTTFVLQDSTQIVYGRNFDFNIGNGFVTNNQRGIFKYAFVKSEKNLLHWTSKYGSLTFNQFGLEFPYGGMNETGLVVAQMYLPETKYPEIDERKVISSLQWIQYQLDVSCSIDEVIASDKILRISNEIPVGIHFLVCDSQGKTATIEFIEGIMVCHTDANLPLPLLTNNTYDESVSYLKQFDVLGGINAIKWNHISDINWTNDNTSAINKVFATAANKIIKTKGRSNLIENAFEVLECVTLNNHTKWSTVFDVTNKLIYFKNENRAKVITLDLNSFKYNSGTNVMILDIQSATPENTMSQFKLYTTEINREYVFDTFNALIESGFFPVQLPVLAIEAHARFPEALNKID